MGPHYEKCFKVLFGRWKMVSVENMDLYKEMSARNVIA